MVFYRPKWEEGEGIEKGGQTSGQTSGQRKGIPLSDKQKKILEILKNKPQISRKELAEAVTGILRGVLCREPTHDEILGKVDISDRKNKGCR